MNDVIIIGGGIIGAFIAYDLSKYNLKISLLEKDNDVANGTTMANSAIVHTGYDPSDNTLKAKLNVEGSLMYENICKQLDVQYKRIGAYVVAKDDEELKVLNELKQRAINRHIPFNELDKDTILKNEPNLNPNIKYGLDFYTTAIIDPMELTVALVEIAIKNGLNLKLNNEVIGIHKIDNYYEVTTNEQVYQSKYVINASGLYSDTISKMIEDNNYQIIPKKGEYFVLDKEAHLTNHIIFPVPTNKGKGVLVVPTVHGNTMLGPTSFEVLKKEEVNTTTSGLNEIRDKINDTLVTFPNNLVIRSFAGIRASVATKDFIIEESPNNKHFINLIGIDSPGIASAPAISKYVIDNFFNDLTLKDKYESTRIGYIHFNNLDEAKKAELIKQNPKYGKIICRCEKITEQEIIDAIHRPNGARTVKGVKKRVRPGMGRCQGGFCEPLVVMILARELHVDPKEIKYDSNDSNILIKESKK